MESSGKASGVQGMSNGKGKTQWQEEGLEKEGVAWGVCMACFQKVEFCYGASEVDVQKLLISLLYAAKSWL